MPGPTAGRVAAAGLRPPGLHGRRSAGAHGGNRRDTTAALPTAPGPGTRGPDGRWEPARCDRRPADCPAPRASGFLGAWVPGALSAGARWAVGPLPRVPGSLAAGLVERPGRGHSPPGHPAPAPGRVCRRQSSSRSAPRRTCRAPHVSRAARAPGHRHARPTAPHTPRPRTPRVRAPAAPAARAPLHGIADRRGTFPARGPAWSGRVARRRGRVGPSHSGPGRPEPLGARSARVRRPTRPRPSGAPAPA